MQSLAAPGRCALLGSGTVAVGGGRDMFSYRSVGGDNASQNEARTVISKPPTPLTESRIIG
jgi:hypothetical protein